MVVIGYLYSGPKCVTKNPSEGAPQAMHIFFSIAIIKSERKEQSCSTILK